LTTDFQINKRVCSEIAVIPSKRLRNKVAGFTTHLMRRIEKGPVRGISFKLQEEERERKDNYVPEVSIVNTSNVEVDADTLAMLKAMDFGDLPAYVVQLQIIACPTLPCIEALDVPSLLTFHFLSLQRPCRCPFARPHLLQQQAQLGVHSLPQIKRHILQPLA
jgi:hypothetical protein